MTGKAHMHVQLEHYEKSEEQQKEQKQQNPLGFLTPDFCPSTPQVEARSLAAAYAALEGNESE